MEIKGKGGSLRTGGRTVAVLGEWEMEGRTDDWRVDAHMSSHNPLWLAGAGPFELRLTLIQGQWRWRDVSVNLFGGMLILRGTTRWELIGAG